jgi:PST family polysaccharide transporter
LVSRVSFPAFAAMQADRDETVGHWLAVTRKSALISFPLLALLALEARDFVAVVLSPKWLPVVAPLRLLCVVGAIRVLTPIVINLLPALGRSDLAFRYTLVNITVMPLSFYLGCRMGGITGVGWAWVLVFPFIAFGLIGKALTLTGVSWRVYLRNLQTPVIGTLLAAAAMLPCLYLLPGGLLRLVLSCAAGAVAYIACFLLTQGRVERVGAGRGLVWHRLSA